MTIQTHAKILVKDSKTINTRIKFVSGLNQKIETVLKSCTWLSSTSRSEAIRVYTADKNKIHKEGGAFCFAESPTQSTIVWVHNPSWSPFAYATAVRKSLSDLVTTTRSSAMLDLSDIKDDQSKVYESIVGSVSSVLEALMYQIKGFHKKTKPARLKKYNLALVHPSAELLKNAKLFASNSVTVTKGTNLVRFLADRPANDLTPETYRKDAEELGKKHGFKTKFHSIKDLEKRGAGAFLAVAQGCSHPHSGILELTYTPQGTAKNRKKLALVGKGLCYDTGGVNLKPANYMFGMQADMTGSAVALASLITLKELGVPYEVKAFLALTDNAIGSRAYRPNEVVVASNGISIEVVHTDAEGRMALADTLVLASEWKPDLMIDYATLTGTAVAAIGTRMGAVFTNRQKMHPTLLKAGHDSGERVWPFPLEDDYAESLTSTIADTKQCLLASSPDHIEATLFLKKFVESDLNWVHLDLSSCEHEGGLGVVGTKTTGFGVKFTTEFVNSWHQEETEG